jgi:hypothetical protein
MQDQVIDAAMAHALHADACRNHAAVAWAVFWDLPAYPERYAARLATSGSPPVPSPYLMLADTLAGTREMLPPGLVRSERQPDDPPEVVEIRFSEQALNRRLQPSLMLSLLGGSSCSSGFRTTVRNHMGGSMFSKQEARWSDRGKIPSHAEIRFCSHHACISSRATFDINRDRRTRPCR